MSPRPGPKRKAVNVRASETGREALQKRAEAETDGNVSEMARRLLAYGLYRMPKDWTPERDRKS